MNVFAFGIVKDIFKSSAIDINKDDATSVDKLKLFLENKFPRLGELSSYMVAVNNEYASTNLSINEKDEIAIIPPVSGG